VGWAKRSGKVSNETVAYRVFFLTPLETQLQLFEQRLGIFQVGSVEAPVNQP
jgi:hypothetical protein